MATALTLSALTPGTREWLEQAVTISLFTDARLPEGAPAPDDSGDRRGHWADLWLPVNESLGSLLWTLRREKLTRPTINRAADLARDALRWMISTPYVTAVNVAADRAEPSPIDPLSATWTLALLITLTLASGEQLPIDLPLTGAT